MADDKWVGGGGGGSGGSGSKGSGGSGGYPSAYTDEESKSGGSGGYPSTYTEEESESGDSGNSGSEKSPSKKNLYQDLDKILKPVFEGEWKDLDGTKPRKWFTDRMDKETYEKLFEEFLAGPHDDEWSKLNQDSHGNLTRMATHARAIGYMDSMWRDLQILYLTDEITAYEDEKHAIGKWLHQEPEILEFLTPK